MKFVIDRDGGLPSNQVHTVALDVLGRLYFAGPAGLSRYDGSRVRVFDRRDGLLAAGLRTATVAADQRIWLGSDLGVDVVTPDGISIPRLRREAWPYGLVECINAERAHVWLGTAQGVVHVDPTSPVGAMQVLFADDIGFVRDVARVDDDVVVAASSRLGLVAFEGHHLRRLRNPDLPPGTAIESLCVGPSGELIVGGSGGLWWLDREGATIHAVRPTGGVDGVVGALAVEGDTCWVGWGEHLLVYRMGVGPPRAVDQYRFGSRINHLHLDALGNVWAATDNSGVACVSCLRTAVRDVDIGARGAVFAIKYEHTSALRVSGERLDRHLDLAASPVAATEASAPATTVAGLWILDVVTGETLRRVTGLRGAGDWEFTTSRALTRGPGSVLYCGVNAGLLTVDLDALHRFDTPPSVHLDRVQWAGVVPEPDGDGWVVPPGKWSVEVSVFAAWFVDHRHLDFRFFLVGFDERWSAPVADASVRFSSLPPGDYRLECQVTSPLVGRGPVATVLLLRVGHPGLAARMAGLLEGLGTGLDVLLRSVGRSRRLLTQSRVIDAEVQARTQALEEANAALRHLADDLRERSLTDGLTGLGNRRHLDLVLARELERGKRDADPVGLLMIDVDHFKRYNDLYGHPAGDACLREIASVLRRKARVFDFAARYGGEEFVVVLPHGTTSARIVAERIHAAIAEVGRVHSGAPNGTVSVSIGYAIAGPETTAAELIKDADAALYWAKGHGRDQVAAAGDRKERTEE